MNKYIKKILFPFVDNNLDLELKWWHRLIKVIFTLLIIISLIASMFLYYYSQKNNNSSYLKSSGFSLIPTANDSNNQDLLQQYLQDTKQDNNSKQQLFKALQDGTDPNELINYLQTSGYKGTYGQTTTQIQEQGFFKKIIIAILLSIISTYILNLLLQIIYYKIILYVIYGKNLNSSATTKN